MHTNYNPYFMNSKLLIVALSLFAAISTAKAVSPGVLDAYSRESFTDQTGSILPYRLLKPERIEEGQRYPLVIFLHGSGERGNDNEAQLTHGGSVFTNPAVMEKYPAFVIFPQCPEDSQWSPYDKALTFNDSAPIPEENDTEKALVELIKQTIADNPVDANRIYISGLSMGGIGTFDLACRYPELFAAAAPMCGAVNPTRLTAAKDVRFLIFHGADDDVVPTVWSRKAYKALREAGADVRYVEFAGTNHNCWTPAFNYPEYLEWMFSQRK